MYRILINYLTLFGWKNKQLVKFVNVIQFFQYKDGEFNKSEAHQIRKDNIIAGYLKRNATADAENR